MSSGVSSMDIRLPMGLMFTIMGAIIAIFGLVDPDQSRSLDVNINLWWGIPILVFGLFMLFMAIAAGRKVPNPRDPAP